MQDDKKIKNFFAADIEKYHKGLLSARERHELEKAALDDPFLADALEGYALAGVNPIADINELKRKLSDRTNKTKVVPLASDQRTFRWWFRVAVMIIVVAGAGILVYQFVFNKKTNEVAQNKIEEIKPISKDSEKTTTPVTIIKDKTIASTNSEKKESKNISSTHELSNKPQTNIVSSPKESGKVASPSFKRLKKESIAATQSVKEDSANLKNTLAEKSTFKSNNNQNDFFVHGVANKKPARISNDKFAIASNMNNNAAILVRNNVFRGEIVDANNNPLPFANITNVDDSVGTYADAKGNFNIVSPDTVLNVQVQSLGYTNTITQLHNNVKNNSVTLQENKDMDAVVISHKKINSERRSLDNNMKVEESEPDDGWYNYDVYLANNLKVPETIRTKHENGEVEISFEVNKNGEPTNLKVEKSLCNECDKEAIRLIKQGPKWKRKAKRGRTMVAIPF